LKNGVMVSSNLEPQRIGKTDPTHEGLSGFVLLKFFQSDAVGYQAVTILDPPMSEVMVHEC
jgi:hypothetical protein